MTITPSTTVAPTSEQADGLLPCDHCMGSGQVSDSHLCWYCKGTGVMGDLADKIVDALWSADLTRRDAKHKVRKILEITDSMVDAAISVYGFELEHRDPARQTMRKALEAAICTPPPQDTPAPVMEGAQREAVALLPFTQVEAVAKQECLQATDSLTRDVGAVIYRRLMMRLRMLTSAPPHPDRVQPERVEAVCKGTGTPECHFRMAERIIGDPRVSVCVTGSNENGQNAIAKPAPPTDASGGVTAAMVEAALRATVDHDDAFDSEDRKLMRAALEAADRARNPVDASAQPAAGEDQMEQWMDEVQRRGGI